MTRMWALVAVCLVASACAVGEPVAGEVEWIVGGTLEPGEPAVVVVYNQRGGLCSGTLISPRVVLSAKHCVQRSGATAPSPPSAFIIGVGSSLRRLSDQITVIDVRTTPGPWTDTGRGLGGELVGKDISVLTLARGLTFPTIPLRRTSPVALIGQPAVAIGFGQTPRGETGTKYRATTTVQGVTGGVVYTGPATCQGDSGGPIIDPATGELIGVTSFGTGACGTGVAGANRVDLFLDLIDAAVGASGACLDDGAERCDGFDNDCDDMIDEGCLALGTACATDDECIGTNCADTSAGRICTATCDPVRPHLCPTGMYCAQTAPGTCDGLCVPLPADPGSRGNDQTCTENTECASLFCTDPGDGRRRCLEPCQGDTGTCLAGDVCAVVPGACGGCVPAALVAGRRGIGEPCAADAECQSSYCFAEAGLRYCGRTCVDDTECPGGFHCRDNGDGTADCVRGERQPTGGACLANDDCLVEGTDRVGCLSRGAIHWCSPIFPAGTTCGCPTGFECTAVAGAEVCASTQGVLGETCAIHADCLSGTCALIGDGTERCSRQCGTDAPCAPGFQCVRTSDGLTGACLPPFAPEDGCCTVAARGGQGRRGWVSLGLLGVVLLARRRRRR